MSFFNLPSPVRVFILAVALGVGGAAQAQQVAVKAKTKTTTSPGNDVTKNQGTAPVPSSPQPVSPLTSSPQVILPAPADGVANWLTDLGAAQAQAKATNRPVLAVFSGSDWCKPCIIYEQEVFAKPEFAAYAKDRLVLAHFDFPRQKRNQPAAAQVKLNEAAAAQLNRGGDFPLAVLIAPDGKVLAKTGYIAGGPTAFQAYLKKVVPTL